MASQPTPGPLEVTLTGANFPQAGSWSMFDVARFPVQQTIAMFSRHANARIQPYTLLLAEAMGLSFRLSLEGRTNLEGALSKLMSVGTFGNILYIGFGIYDITRTMVRSEGLAMMMGLCAALMECYPEDFAVEVMLELARATRAEENYMPSNLEWRNLLHLCAGCLAASTFPQVAEHFMQLGDTIYGGRTWKAFRPTKNFRHKSTSSSVAAAIVALAKLSKGEMDAVTIVGHCSIGWLAAVSDWILGLRITIYHGDELLHTNCKHLERPQVKFVFEDDDEDEDEGTMLRSASGERRTTPLDMVDIKDRTYRMEMDKARDLFSFCQHQVSGRVPWESALSSVFGARFNTIMAAPDVFGCMIGSAAGIMRHLAAPHAGLDQSVLLSCLNYCDRAHGLEYISQLVMRFPELAPLRPSMERAATKTFQGLKHKYNTCFDTFQSRCTCCACVDFTRNQKAIGSQDPEYRKGALEGPREDPICLVKTIETIIVIGETLANINLECQDISPTMAGLYMAYERVALRHNSRLDDELLCRLGYRLGKFMFCTDVFEVLQRQSRLCINRLNFVGEIFSGRPPRSNYTQFSAIWVNGISVFLSTLTSEHDDSNNEVGQVHVVPGRITFQGKSYESLADQSVDDHESLDPETLQNLLKSYQTQRNLHGQRGRKAMTVRETSYDLECCLEFSFDGDRSSRLPTIRVGSSKFAQFLWASRGRVHCPHKRRKPCKPVPGAEEIVLSEHGKGDTSWSTVKVNGFELTLVDLSSCLAKLMMLAGIADERSYFYKLKYIIEQECEMCCLRTVMDSGRDPSNRKVIIVRI